MANVRVYQKLEGVASYLFASVFKERSQLMLTKTAGVGLCLPINKANHDTGYFN